MISKQKKICYFLVSVVLLSFGRASVLWPLAPITAICGYALAWKSLSSRPFLSAWLLFSLTNLISHSWLLSHPFSYIILVWLLVSLLFALPYALISKHIVTTDLNFSRIIQYAALLTLTEWLFTVLPCGFSFQTAALHLSWHAIPLQTASLVGASGLAFLVFLTNLFIYANSWIAIIFALIPYAIGTGLFWHHVEEQKKASHIKLAICHMNEEPDVWMSHLSPPDLHTQEWNKVLSLLSPLENQKVDLIVLPEGVVPFPAYAQLYDARLLPSAFSVQADFALSSLDIAHIIAHKFDTSIILGLESGGYPSHNSCYFVNRDKIERYDKQLLLPLGEYIPFELLSSWLASYGIHSSFSPGNEAKILDADNLALSPLICYEETFATYTEKASKLAPKALVSLSNDNWFPNSGLAKLHLEVARLRAVEIGRPLIRSCNKGASAAIDALGQTVAQKEGDAGVVICSLAQYSHPTLYQHIGATGFAYLFLSFSLISCFPKRKIESIE